MYSNTNYWMLARVIEAVSGEPYARYMQTRLFTPLGMSATRSSLPNQLLPGRAAGYEWTSGHLENRDPIQPHTDRGLGDIATTVGDMARWEAEQRAPRLISAESARRARTPVLLNDGSATDYGYGWFTHPVAGEPALSHEG